MSMAEDAPTESEQDKMICLLVVRLGVVIARRVKDTVYKYKAGSGRRQDRKQLRVDAIESRQIIGRRGRRVSATVEYGGLERSGRVQVGSGRAMRTR